MVCFDEPLSREPEVNWSENRGGLSLKQCLGDGILFYCY